MQAQFQIIGGGLVGLATAYALLEKGASHVRLIEAGKAVALETSYANAGMVHASLANPWNGPGIFGQLLGSMVSKNTSMKLRASALPDLLGWGPKFLRSSANTPHWRATELNYALAQYSMGLNRKWREDLSIDDAYDGDGLLKIFRTPRAFAQARDKALRLQALGLRTEFLSAQDSSVREPALAPIIKSIAGAIFYPDDFKADAYRFCKALEIAILERGGEIITGTRVEGFLRNGDSVHGVKTDTGDFQARTTIVATGARSYLLLKTLGLALPVRPVKGYSLGFSNIAGPKIPMVSKNPVVPKIPVVDDSLHVAITPLENCLRIAGMAEIAGFDRSVHPKRLQPLLDMLKHVYPELATGLSLEDAQIWHGFRPVSADGIPMIGLTPLRGLAVNTAHAHMGWTLCAGSGALLADIVLEESPVLDPAPYAPFRR
ncbi:MAG: hypothetical protein COA69_05935 [Robiginitomaculum sp.]|nr:MAG: hypothetical protein COA69_05935 [Robiginitomaculum sp.]